MAIVIRNCRVMQTEAPFDVTEDVDVVIDGSVIAAVGKEAGKDWPGAEVMDGKGKTVMPGNVCSHHHYYSGLSRGMLVSSGPQTDLIQVLTEWWWRLDMALDEEACYYSSLICSMDAIASGTTSVVDHHASPSYIEGSLSTIAKGMEEIGIRGATCYEVTDRNGGMREVERGVEENVRFAREERPMVGALIGGHAPFTIPEKGLELISEAMEATGKGMHLHVAEGDYDAIWSHHMYHEDIVRRLDRHHLLNDKTLLVHGIYLNDSEIDLLNERGCFFAHNPRSNMNNHVGFNSKIPRIKKLVIGTDGCGGNMFEELKIGFMKNQDAGLGWWPADYVQAMNRGNRLVESIFGDTFSLGRVEKGYKADVVILDYKAPTPLVKENAASHFVWGISSNAVESVIIDGKIVYKDHRFPGIDADSIYREARRVAERVWERTEKIKAKGVYQQ